MPTLKRTPHSAEVTISEAEIARRKQNIKTADHENLLEGLKRPTSTDQIFDSYARGEISSADLTPLLKKHFADQSSK